MMGIRGRLGRTATTLAIAMVVGACGADEEPFTPDPDPLLQPFIGVWDATVLTVRSVGDTSQVADLLENGESYIRIEDSGSYQSTIAFDATPFVEFGTLGVSEQFLTLRPRTGDPVTREYEFTAPDVVRLEGPTDWDFNKDGDRDPGTLFMEMVRR